LGPHSSGRSPRVRAKTPLRFHSGTLQRRKQAKS
jgi:hypothetical protein